MSVGFGDLPPWVLKKILLLSFVLSRTGVLFWLVRGNDAIVESGASYTRREGDIMERIEALLFSKFAIVASFVTRWLFRFVDEA